MKETVRGIKSFLIVACVLISSCGLPKTLYLSPPDFSSSGDNLLVLTHTIDNYDASEGLNQSFKGYEIYYKAYASYSLAENAVASLQTSMSTYSSNPTQFMNIADDLGFVRIRRESTSAKPLITIAAPDSDAWAQVQIPSVLDSRDWELTTTNPSSASPIPVFRSILDQTRWSFYDTRNFHEGDADYSGASDPSNLHFVFFAVAYGKDPEATWQDIYSLPDTITVSGNLISYP